MCVYANISGQVERSPRRTHIYILNPQTSGRMTILSLAVACPFAGKRFVSIMDACSTYGQT